MSREPKLLSKKSMYTPHCIFPRRSAFLRFLSSLPILNDMCPEFVMLTRWCRRKSCSSVRVVNFICVMVNPKYLAIALTICTAVITIAFGLRLSSVSQPTASRPKGEALAVNSVPVLADDTSDHAPLYLNESFRSSVTPLSAIQKRHPVALDATPLGIDSPHTLRSVRQQYRGSYGWVFQKYISSPIEIEFLEAVRPFARKESFAPLVERFQNKTLAYLAAKPRFVPDDPFTSTGRFSAQCRKYASSSRSSAHVDDSISKATCMGSVDAMDENIFSRFIYEFVCLSPPCDPKGLPPGRAVGDTHTSYIEPLFGYLRHPRMFQSDGFSQRALVNKAYMIVDKWALNHLYTRWQHNDRRRTHFYDLGASTYVAGTGGASQNWFVGLSECMCVPFTEMRMWEAVRVSPRVIFHQVARHMIPSYHYVNMPLSASLTSWQNPLNQLLRNVKSDASEPVVLKVDFESPKPERAIIETVINTPELYSLVDELFFEHHVILGRMTRFWTSILDQGQTIVSSIELFLRLRHRGVRAHSWV